MLWGAGREGKKGGGGSLPLVQPRKLIFAFLVPLAASLEVVLVVKAATDGAPAREALRDVVPFHAAAPKFDNESVLLGRPLALLLGRGLGRVWRHAALSSAATGTWP